MEAHELQRVALVAGVKGIAGLSVAELLVATGGEQPAGGWRVYGVARSPKPSWFEHPITAYLQCDLLDREQTLATLSPLADVTHLFYTSYTHRDTEEEALEANASMLRNTLDALLGKAKGLQHVSLLTGTKQYLGSFENILQQAVASRGGASLRVFYEDEPRLPGPNLYHVQEDMLLAAVLSGQIKSWSVHRAAAITGVSPGGTFNMLLFLAFYALMCKQEGLPFCYPGDPISWESHTEFSDSGLIAEQLIWAATHPTAHNQAFNISNGDMVSWKQLWPVVASFFDLAVAPYTGEPLRLVDAMKSKAQVWDSIVSQYNIHPTRWEHLCLGWFTLDVCFLSLPPHRLSMEKSSKLGFQSSRDSTTCLLDTFEEMRKRRIIP